MEEISCVICGKELENLTVDYLCERCEINYGNYDDDEPVIQPMRKRKKYDDERR